VERPDSNTVSISYSANCSTATDEAGKARKSCSDGLGRLTQVYEDPSGVNYLTTYAYDALNDLTSVTQGSQTRTYSYDALGRLTAATTTESGTANFYYTTSGGGLCAGDPSAVCRRTDARGTTTTYTYDALNRLTQKTYSDSTPTALFYYDESSVNVSGTVYATPNGLGRLTHTARRRAASCKPPPCTVTTPSGVCRTIGSARRRIARAPASGICATITIWGVM
jgi:YD repeat-containing protein